MKCCIRIFALFAITGLSFSAHRCGQGMRPELANSLGFHQKAAMKETTLAFNEFARQLYTLLGTESKNLIFSPLSIEIALLMLYFGARGKTAEDIINGLRYGSGDEEKAKTHITQILEFASSDKQLQIASEMFVEKTYKIREEFKKQISDNFDAQIPFLDFANDPEAANTYINQWVANKTSNRITELFPPGSIDTDTIIVLANTVYFENLWLDYFDSRLTHEATFYVSEDKSSRVQMMESGTHTLYGYSETSTYQLLAAPYKEGNASLLVFLPKSTFGLGEVEKELANTKNIAKLLYSVKETYVSVGLPKLNFDFSAELKHALDGLGMTDLYFEPDLSGITPPGEKELRVSETIHKGFIEINEAGTIAGAATGIKITPRSLIEAPRFQADHPFIFYILKEGVIIFAGKFVSP